MSDYRRLDRRIRLRSQALLEPYSVARENVLSMSPDDPVIPPAGRWQARLEGYLFPKISSLYVDLHKIQRRVFRINPQEHSMALWISDDKDHSLAHYLADALPKWRIGENSIEEGISGLRYRPIGGRQGVQLYVLGQPCSIEFYGISVSVFQDALTSRRGFGYFGVGSEQVICPQEQNISWKNHLTTDIATSAIVRRIGLLFNNSFKGYDMWISCRDDICVEIFQTGWTEEQGAAAISMLASPELSPRLSLSKHPNYGIGHRILSVDGETAAVDLRIQDLLKIFPPPVVE